MRFSWKILLASVVVLALGLAAGGTLLIQYTFQEALERETEQALSENLYAARSLDLAVYAEYARAAVINDMIMQRVGQMLNENGMDELLLVSGDGVILSRYGFERDELDEWMTMSDTQAVYRDTSDQALRPKAGERNWVLRRTGGRARILVTIRMETYGYEAFLTTGRDVESVFEQRTRQFSIFRMLSAVIILVGALAMMALSTFMTRPIRRLTRAARKIRAGNYAVRARASGGGELYELAESFNEMAGSVEKNIAKLTQVARQREEFVASFAHELKTPLTSIIGYADMLRGQNLPPEKAFIAANYIYSEGRRLESLSLKLMEMIVLGSQRFELKPTDAKTMAEEVAGIAGMALKKAGMTLETDVQAVPLRLEPDLFKTMLINLIDNARKASAEGAVVRLNGAVVGRSYVFSVQDHGRGIPQEEIHKITEAFYMVDKSRARAQHGAGLGLALCDGIARLHGSELTFQSEVGKGTTVSISLQLPRKKSARRRNAA